MNFGRIGRLLGILLIVLAICMASSIPWAIAYDEMDTLRSFLYSCGITVISGGVLTFLGRNQKGTLHRSEAILLVALSWFLLGVFGGLPYLFDGAVTHPVDAYFETISGFTTTGSTILSDIAGQSRGLHWWRAMTHWLGGMGIVVLFVAIFPQLGVGGKFLFKSEVPGPITEGLTPKIKQTAATLWWIYFGFTAVQSVVLLFCGMNLHDALCHAMATMATGGFSTQNGSVADYNSATIDYVIAIFMLLAGINFGLYSMIRKRGKKVFDDRELHVYLGLILVASIVVAINITGTGDLTKHGSFIDSFRYAFFQVVGVITTTGFGTDNFNLYPPFSKMILVVLMFVGGMAGSTAGGMKVIRFIVIFKAIYVEIYRVFRPSVVMATRVGGAVISKDRTQAILSFFAISMLIFGVASLYMAYLGLDIVTATTSVAATLFNIGPGLAKVGSIENFKFIPTSGKVVLSFCMILGRLEFMTILVLLIPEFWKR